MFLNGILEKKKTLLTDPFQELAVGNALELGVSRIESCILKVQTFKH